MIKLIIRLLLVAADFVISFAKALVSPNPAYSMAGCSSASQAVQNYRNPFAEDKQRLCIKRYSERI